MKELAYISLMFCITMLPSCKLDLAEDEVNISSEGIKVAGELFKYSADNGEYQVKTNDRKYIHANGSTFWNPLRSGSRNYSKASFDSWEVEVTKHSGERDAGYGIILCQQRSGVESMQIVMIRIDRHYQIGEATGKSYEALDSWKFSRHLKSGYGIFNSIKVEREGDKFALYLNGNKVESFKPIHEGGIQGFVAVFSSLESFPDNFVHIRFKEKAGN